MKHIITTTTFFDSALGKVVSGDSTDIIIFAKIKDVVPVRLMQDVTEKENLKIRVIYSETKEENLLWLFLILLKRHMELKQRFPKRKEAEVPMHQRVDEAGKKLSQIPKKKKQTCLLTTSLLMNLFQLMIRLIL